MGLVLIVALAGSASAEPSTCANISVQGYKVPGRKPDSQLPWEFFLGNASHRLIAYIYGTRHPANSVYYNKDSIRRILEKTGIGDTSLLSTNERELRPDITDATALTVYEIKPSTETGLQEGIQKTSTYLLALNRTLEAPTRFSAGRAFEGETLIQFAQGQYIWRLEWCTATPGVTQYRWTRSQERFDSNLAAYQAAQWVEISEQELKKYGGWVAQAIDGMVDRREQLSTLQGAIGIAINVVGEVALLILSTSATGERGTYEPGGKLLPFPAKPPTSSPVQLPRASGM